MIDFEGIGAQEIIIGSALRYGATESTVNAFSRLSEEMFSSLFLRDAFKAIRTYIDTGSQFASFDIDDLMTRTLNKAGGSPHEFQFKRLADLEVGTSISETKGHVNHLIGCYQARTLMQKLNESVEVLASGVKASEVMVELESTIAGIDNSAEVHAPSSADDLIDSYTDHLETKMGSMGIRTGFCDCDKLIGRVHPGNLIIVGGRSGQGKTEFACNWALNAAQDQNLNILFFSLEMGKQELMDRFVAINMRKPVSYLDNPAGWNDDEMGSSWSLVGNAALQLRGKSIHIHDEQGLTISKMRSVMKKVEIKTGRPLDAVFIDYLQIMKMPGKRTRYEEMCDLSVALKSVAKEFGIPVIALAQLNRESAKAGREPMNHDIKDCGQIEQDADIIMFVYRDTENKENEGLAKIIFSKMRQGKTGAAVLQFDNGHFYDCMNQDAFMSQADIAAANRVSQDSQKTQRYSSGYKPV